MTTKKLKDDEGNVFEVDVPDNDDDDEEDEDDDNIYLTEKDLRFLKELRKSQSSDDKSNSKRKSGVSIRKKLPQEPPKKNRVRKLTLSR